MALGPKQLFWFSCAELETVCIRIYIYLFDVNFWTTETTSYFCNDLHLFTYLNGSTSIVCYPQWESVQLLQSPVERQPETHRPTRNWAEATVQRVVHSSLENSWLNFPNVILWHVSDVEMGGDVLLWATSLLGEGEQENNAHILGWHKCLQRYLAIYNTLDSQTSGLTSGNTLCSRRGSPPSWSMRCRRWAHSRRCTFSSTWRIS